MNFYFNADSETNNILLKMKCLVTSDESGGSRLLLLVADGLMVSILIVLELLHVGLAVVKVLLGSVGLRIEL